MRAAKTLTFLMKKLELKFNIKGDRILDNYEFIRELNDLIYKNTDHLNPFDIIICTFSTLACFIEHEALHKEAAYLTVEMYKECLDKAYSIPDKPESN